MGIIVLTAVVLASITLEGMIFNRARKRARDEEIVAARLARCVGRKSY